jgi:hypothetical protein
VTFCLNEHSGKEAALEGTESHGHNSNPCLQKTLAGSSGVVTEPGLQLLAEGCQEGWDAIASFSCMKLISWAVGWRAAANPKPPRF